MPGQNRASLKHDKLIGFDTAEEFFCTDMQSLSAILQMVRANALSIVHFREKEYDGSEKTINFRND